MGHRPGRWAAAAALWSLLCPGPGRALAGSFVNFESGHVRPLALGPGGDQLFAVNTPDNRLAIYTVTTAGPGLTLAAEVPVGLEPVAVATRTNAAGRTEAWVVNHLSDSVSIVEVDPTDATRSRVRRTLLVGDEPRDIVFAGPGKSRAFITAAHRGQNRPGDPELTVEDKPRADVWVFDATDPGASALAGTPLVVLALKGDTPRALAATDDGATVYAAVFFSGNQTTTIPQPAVSKPIGPGLPPSPGRLDGPDTGLIVRLNPATGKWEDELAQDWSNRVPFVLADRDVFVIDATASPPAPAAGTSAIRGVGTVLFNMAVRPGTSKVYVTNTEARNQIRFEPFVRAHVVDTRITVISGGVATPVDLNSHITYGTAEQIPGPASEVSQSIGLPLGMAFSPDGKLVYVAAFGSAKIAALDADKLEAGTTKPRTLVPVGGGPTGLVVDGARDRLYVMNRFDHTVSVVTHAGDLSQIGAGPPVSLRFTPEPPEVRQGRPFLYDATTTSAHSDVACATCHVFGDFDGLAWDLGDPTKAAPDLPNNNPFLGPRNSPTFHPMKGPMTTQSLRAMADAGPMHWRGDRSGGNVEISLGAFGDPLDETLAFKQFEGAFSGLLGGTIGTHMDALTRFILTVRYPPNPIRALDNSLSSAEQRGRTFFINTPVDGGRCADCHVLDLGTDGRSSFDAEPQDFKMAHLRNLYAKIGRFGMPTPPSTVPGMNGNSFHIPGHTALGEQVRGFGFLHDGSVSSLDDFLHADVFEPGFGPDPAMPPRLREDVAAFLLGFDTGLKPAVGQQVTVTSTGQTDTGVDGRITLLLARANAGDCDLVAKGVLANVPRGWVHLASTGGDGFRSDRAIESPLPEPSLRAQAATVGQEVTYTCVPPGSGTRIGVDRDEDGVFDRDELDAGTDPALPPTTTSTTSTSSTSSTTTSTAPPCANGVQDGRETDVDCGGACCCPKGVLAKNCRVYRWDYCVKASCKRCRGGQRCVCNSDCTSGKCELVSIGPVGPGKLGVVRRCAPDVIVVPPPVFDRWWWLKGPGPLAVAADLVYVPAKVGLAAVGGVATGVTYVATLGNTDAARSVWVTTTGGDYVVTPRMVAEGRMPQFLGDTTVEMSP